MKLKFIVVFFVSFISFSETTWAMLRLYFREDVNSTGISPTRREGGDYRGRGTFTGERVGQKETREEYADRRERMAKEKLEKSRTYAERLGIDGASSMSAYRLESEIQDKKAEKKRENELRKREESEAELAQLREHGSSIGVTMARFKDARTLKDEIKYKEKLKTAERMGVSVAQWMSQGELEEKIRSKKGENEREMKEKKLQERRNFAERMGVSDARWMSQKELEETIKRKKKEKEERNKESLGMRRETREFSGAFNTPDDFLRHITRKPGEQLSYKERLEERRAFVSRGGFDSGLCRTSDDIGYNYMESIPRSYHVDDIC